MRERIINPLYPYTYGRMCCAVKRLKERYTDLIRTVCVAHSTQGRCIPVLSMGSGSRKILAVSTIHGREYVSTGYILLCLEEYAEAFYSTKLYCGFNIREILEDVTFHIVPMANPDSAEIALGRSNPCVCKEDFCAYFYKNNANNVNINANFPFEWQAVPKSRQGGASAGSEPETEFLMNLCEKHRYEKMLSFHTRGDCIYWRDKGNGEIEGDKKLSEALCKVCAFSLCPQTEDIKAYSGGFENWFRYRFQRPALCIELISDEDAPFSLCCRDFFALTRWEQTKSALMVSAIV